MDFSNKEKINGGLVNLGSTCYVNTAVQCLSHCISFLNLILNNKNENSNSLINELKVLLIEMWINNHSLRPNKFISALKNGITDINIHEQNDINEFLSLFLEKLNKDICYKNVITKEMLMSHNKYKKNSYDIQRFKMDISWLDKTRNEYSELMELFYGQSITQIICGHCNHISHNYEIFSSIMLSICDTLDGCISKYFTDEYLNNGDNNSEWQCDECKQKKRSKKTTKIWRLPKILIITLKRFTDNLQKNDNNVKIPFDIDLSQYTLSRINTKFKLNSVACHFGSFFGGHYTALCKYPNNKWYNIDDLSVVEINNMDEISRCGYVFFYT